MPPPKQHETSDSYTPRRRGFWAVIIVLCLAGFGILIAALAPFVRVFVAFETAMYSFGPGPHARQTQAPRWVELAGFILAHSLLRFIYFVAPFPVAADDPQPIAGGQPGLTPGCLSSIVEQVKASP
jgi:hypothetical protein